MKSARHQHLQGNLLVILSGLTAAIVNYRIAELELQRDMGVLRINEKGLWQEFSLEENNHYEKK